MRSDNEHMQAVESSTYRELQILSEVERSSEVTQRELSQRVGVALGLTNLMLRNLAQKGYLRVAQASWKRWIYTLTPEGLAQKIRLTAAYIHRVLDHYRHVRQTLRDQLEPLALHEESRVALYGATEFAELVYLGLKELGIDEIDIYDPDAPPGRKFLGLPVQDVATLQPDEYDKVMVAILGDTTVPFAELEDQGVAEEKLVQFFAGG